MEYDTRPLLDSGIFPSFSVWEDANSEIPLSHREQGGSSVPPILFFEKPYESCGENLPQKKPYQISFKYCSILAYLFAGKSYPSLDEQYEAFLPKHLLRDRNALYYALLGVFRRVSPIHIKHREPLKNRIEYFLSVLKVQLYRATVFSLFERMNRRINRRKSLILELFSKEPPFLSESVSEWEKFYKKIPSYRKIPCRVRQKDLPQQLQARHRP